MDGPKLYSIQNHLCEAVDTEHPKLLSEIDLSDTELDVLRSNSHVLITDAICGRRRYDLTIAYLMMDVGMRNYSDGDYWTNFWDEVAIDYKQNDQTILGNFFLDVLRNYNLAIMENSGRKFVNNILMHALIPENQAYRDAFFNFVLRFYRIVLNGKVPEDLDDKLQIMADVFRQGKLEDYPEMNSISLIVPTKQALSDARFFGNTVKKIIHRFAEAYDSLDEVNLGRYEKSFREWSNSQQHRKERRHGIGEKPYVHFDISQGKLYLAIPSMELRDSSQNTVEVRSSIGEIIHTDRLLSSFQFGKIVSDDRAIEIKWNPLDAYSILIGGRIVFENNNPGFLILNKNGNQRFKVALGFNMLVLPKGMAINLESVVLVDREYDIRAFMINKGEALEIGGQSFSVEDEVTPDIHIITSCIDMGCTDQDGNRFNAYSVHPEIRISGILKKRFKLSVSHGLNSVKFDSMEALMSDTACRAENGGTVLDLSKSYLRSEPGIYHIRFNGREVYRYVLMPDFKFEFEKPLYEEDETSFVRYSGNDIGVTFNTRDGIVSLDPISLDGRELTLVLQVPSRRFSFDKKIWYMFGKELYYRETQHSRLFIYCPTLVYPKIEVKTGSKPIDLEIEGRLLVCDFTKISMISTMIEHSKQAISHLRFRCGRFDLFTIRYSADYSISWNKVIRTNAPDNTWAVIRENSTGREYRVEDSIEIPDDMGDYTILEFYGDDFGSECLTVKIQEHSFHIPAETAKLIRAGDDFISITYHHLSVKFTNIDFRNLVENDKPYDPSAQRSVQEKYARMGASEERYYLTVKNEIKNVILQDMNFIRLKKRAKRFTEGDPLFSYQLCCACLELSPDSEMEELKDSLKEKAKILERIS